MKLFVKKKDRQRCECNYIHQDDINLFSSIRYKNTFLSTKIDHLGNLKIVKEKLRESEMHDEEL